MCDQRTVLHPPKSDKVRREENRLAVGAELQAGAQCISALCCSMKL